MIVHNEFYYPYKYVMLFYLYVIAMNRMSYHIDIRRFFQSGLIDIQFANFGQSVVLEFCADNGQSLGYLVCHQVLRFHYIDPLYQKDKQRAINSHEIQGFSHYVHQFHIYQHEQHLHLSLRPYIQLDIECLDIECLAPTAFMMSAE